MFGQDSSFIDSAYLRELLAAQNSLSENQSQLNDHQVNLIKQKILTIERVGKRNQQVDILEDYVQKQTLFKGVNQIGPICVDLKIQMKIKKISNCEIINNLFEYMLAYNQLKQQYQQYNNIQDQINQRQENENNIPESLNKQRFNILEELSNKISQQQEIFTIPMKCEIIFRENFLNKIITKQITKLKLTIRFKIPYKNTFQKQNLHPFYMKQIRILIISFYLENNYITGYFLTNQNPFQEKNVQYINKSQKNDLQLKFQLQYDFNPEQIIDSIEVFISGINFALGTGAQIFRYATYFSNIAEATVKAQQVAKSVNVAAVWANCVLSVVSIGIDAYSYAKGQICVRQMALNTLFNIACVVLSIVAIYVPGIGWLVGGAAGALGLIGYSISELCFTSSQTFDETLGLVLKSIIDDKHPNQILLYFQKYQFLKKRNINSYSQTQSKVAYEMFREIKAENFQKPEQNFYLLKLFNNCQRQRLSDKVSKHISKNIISNLFQFETEQLKDISAKEYLKSIKKQIERNEKIINTFYNRFNDQINNLIKTINVNSKQLNVNDNQDISDKTYQKSLKTFSNEFIKHIKQTDYTYKEQEEFGNGAFRKCDRFPITFNGYCNLVHEKCKFIFMQDTLSQISKNKNRFEVKSENNFQRSFLQFPENELIQYLNILISSDQLVTSRYLLKIQRQKEPNLSFMEVKEVIDCEVEYSIDLYELANKSNSFKDFIEKINDQTKQEFKVDEENSLRLKNFFRSISHLKKIFI
ncbi:hypothetical protein ABPG72_014719 [Tetrahymena utriculariae]